MTTDPYKKVAQCAASVLVQAILTQEYSIPPPLRKECTRFMRLTACRDVDATGTSKIRKTLPGPLHDTAVQYPGTLGLDKPGIGLGPTLFRGYLHLQHSETDRHSGCPFVLKGPESRYHWRHECTQSRPGFLHTYAAISHVLAFSQDVQRVLREALSPEGSSNT